jgi:polyhydroxybutyrate depolymerase
MNPHEVPNGGDLQLSHPTATAKPRPLVAFRFRIAKGKPTAIAGRGFAWAAVIYALLAVTSFAHAKDVTRTVKVGDVSREYLVHIPADAEPDKPLPVVLVFHGGGGNATQMRRMSGMDATADKHGFIAVYPQGTSERVAAMRTWNADNCCGAAQRNMVDDIAFVAALLDDLPKVHTIDARRVYATGMSNGGMISHRLGSEMADRIAAIAPVAGTIGTAAIAPSRPVPVMHFHGTKDDIVNYEGGFGKHSVSKSPFRSVASTINAWRMANRCTADGVEDALPDKADDGMTVTRTTYMPVDAAGAEVILVTIHNGGHTWPGHPLRLRKLGATTTDIDANEMMWAFFQRHALPEKAK